MPKQVSKKSLNALVVETEIDICRSMSLCLEADGHDAACVTSAAAAVTEASRRSFDVIFLDLRSGSESGLDAISLLRAASPWARVVVMAAHPSVETAVESLKRGASDYLAKPLTPAQVKGVMLKAAEAKDIVLCASPLQEALSTAGPAIDFDTRSAEMREAIELARRAADGSASLLVSGETGTGKRTLARAIHAWSPRAERPFALAGSRAPAAQQLEAEWFGEVRRLPGGQIVETTGRIAYADGGTLLVEDVDQLPLSIQPKLLRLIQEREFERRADYAPRRADVRVIATTTIDLERCVAAGQFRADLFYALRGVAIALPPLRRRPDDVKFLAERYLHYFARQTRRPVVSFNPAAMEALRRHSWPGNLRELRTMIERAVLVCRGDQIETPDFPPGILNRVNAVALGDPVTLERVEELHIRGVLAASPSIDAAASTLGMDTVTLWRRRKKYGI